MIRTGALPTTEHPVIRDLRDALGEHIDRRQVEIVRTYLDAPPCWCGAMPTHRIPVYPWSSTPNTTMRDGEPGMNVCVDHLDRDGFEVIA